MARQGGEQARPGLLVAGTDDGVEYLLPLPVDG
jgi:hypothetical protein